MGRLKIIFLFNVLVIGISGCGAGNAAEKSELLRLVHADPDLETVSLSVADDRIFSDVAYKDDTSYVDVVEGTVTGEIRDSDHVLPIVSEDLSIENQKSYTLFLTETAGADDIILVEDTIIDPPDGQFRIRLANFAPSEDSVDVYITPPDGSVRRQDPTVPALGFQKLSAYLNIDEGEYIVKYTREGSKTVIRESQPVEFTSGTYTHVLLDKEGGGRPLTSRLLVDD